MYENGIEYVMLIFECAIAIKTYWISVNFEFVFSLSFTISYSTGEKGNSEKKAQISCNAIYFN